MQRVDLKLDLAIRVSSIGARARRVGPCSPCLLAMDCPIRRTRVHMPPGPTVCLYWRVDCLSFDARARCRCAHVCGEGPGPSTGRPSRPKPLRLCRLKSVMSHVVRARPLGWRARSRSPARCPAGSSFVGRAAIAARCHVEPRLYRMAAPGGRGGRVGMVVGAILKRERGVDVEERRPSAGVEQT